MTDKALSFGPTGREDAARRHRAHQMPDNSDFWLVSAEARGRRFFMTLRLSQHRAETGAHSVIAAQGRGRLACHPLLMEFKLFSDQAGKNARKTKK